MTIMLQKHTKILLLIAILLFLVLPAIALVPPGRITVYSAPSGSQVCIDNKNCDITPATFAVEGNAWHMIVVTESGYRDWIDTVYVTSDLTRVVNAYLDLEPAATAIQANVTPGGGTICLDNSQCRANVGTINSTGTTLFTGVSPGFHTISVESPAGYMDTSNLVKVSLGKISEVNITLEQVIVTPTTMKLPDLSTGMVRVYVDRIGSTICIDNSHCVYNVGGGPGPGTGTTVFDYVTANETHIVTVAADGYEPYAATVSVGKDLIENVDVKLEPIAGAISHPTTVSTTRIIVPVTTPVPSTTTTQPPTMPLPTRSPLDVAMVLSVLALCSMSLFSRKIRK